MDSLKKDLDLLKQTLSPAPRVLEIGCGSGIISAYLSNILKRGVFFATDKNPKAAAAASATFRRNRVRGDVVLTDLVSGLDARLQGSVVSVGGC
jgi:release factor glutamine methyltransferase